MKRGFYVHHVFLKSFAPNAYKSGKPLHTTLFSTTEILFRAHHDYKTDYSVLSVWLVFTVHNHAEKNPSTISRLCSFFTESSPYERET